MEGHATLGFIDLGIEPGHPDLEPYDDSQLVPIFAGGNFRENLSYDYAHGDCNVDEQEGVDPSDNRAGHGMHVAGIAAANADNGLGIAGACWNCPFAMAQFFFLADAVAALNDFRRDGFQIVSMSWGYSEDCEANPLVSVLLLCNALQAANQRDLLLVASSGNSRASVELPARDPRVIAVGGLDTDGSFWDDFPNCPPLYGGDECGSNFGPRQEFVAPAKSVLSTVYTGLEHIHPSAGIPCGDDTSPAGTADDGFGLCTGTSMSAPAVAGIAGLLRSANPLLTQTQIREVLKETASGGGTHTPQLGYGYPDAGAAVRAVMGQVEGVQQTSRLTPFFSLYSTTGRAHLYTTSPQRAAAAIEDLGGAGFSSIGPTVSGYDAFPGISGEAPSASVYLFSTPHGPSGLNLVPLYRLTKDANRSLRCAGLPETATERAFAYATLSVDLVRYRNQGYALDGIEGYLIHPSQTAPAGAVTIHRVYNPIRDDWAIVPNSELASLSEYAATSPYAEILGYAYPNVDSDGDGLINAMETIAGTDPSLADSDGDGRTDGAELLGLDGGELSDPLSFLLFTDGFETGDTSQWSSTVN